MTRIRTRSVTGGVEPRTYKSLVEEIKEIDRAIFECRRELARDKVQTSDKSFPYTQHGKTIEGINLTRLRRLEIQRKRAEIRKMEIEDFVSGIEDVESRRIVRLRCIDGLPWRVIGRRVHMDYSAARKKYNKIMGEVNLPQMPQNP